MRLRFRLLLIVCAVVLVPPLLIAGWFVSGWGLYDVDDLAMYVPDRSGDVLLNYCTVPALSLLLTKRDMQQAFPAYKAAESSDPKTLSMAIARLDTCKRQTKNLPREIEELRLAYRIRRRFSVDEQITILLNSEYFGNEHWGLSDASRHYFGKQPGDLDTAQMATLAGLVAAPSRFSPTNHSDRCLQRRNEVLDRMRDQGSLSAIQAEAAKAEPLSVVAQ